MISTMHCSLTNLVGDHLSLSCHHKNNDYIEDDPYATLGTQHASDLNFPQWWVLKGKIQYRVTTCLCGSVLAGQRYSTLNQWIPCRPIEYQDLRLTYRSHKIAWTRHHCLALNHFEGDSWHMYLQESTAICDCTSKHGAQMVFSQRVQRKRLVAEEQWNMSCWSVRLGRKIYKT